MNSEYDKQFETLYKRLNREQKKAVDTIDGPVMVIAGPGTGKTSILTLRIAQILRKTDTPASAILALTFTESGVRAMRKKLIDIIGPRGYEVKIYTFHGFCNEIIRSHPERFDRVIGARAIDEVEQIKLLEEIIEREHSVKLLRPIGDPVYYVRPSLRAIEELKREYISPTDFQELIEKEQSELNDNPERMHVSGKYKGKIKGEFLKKQEKIDKNRELVILYEQYEKSLAQGRLFDYNDMIIEVIKALKADENFLLELQEGHQYILADEHQDANQSQNTLLELLSGFFEEPNLFIVGDEKQAIFRFQGASLENFLYFKKRFPSATMIQLKTNYRSRQSILDLSHALISNNNTDESLRVELQAGTVFDIAGKEITLREYQDERSELRHLGEDIAKKIESGIPASEIAVLYRENWEAEVLAKVLRAHKVPFVVHSDTNLFDDEGIFLFLTLLKAVHEPHKEQYLIPVFLSPFGKSKIEPIEVMRSVEEAKKSRQKLGDYLLEVKKESKLTKAFEEVLNSTKLSVSEPLVPFLERVMAESGLLEWIIQGANSVHQLKLVHVLLGLAQGLVSRQKNARLADFLDAIRIHEEHGLMVKGTGGETGKDEVHLMTAHRSKGLEFDVVYIVRLIDKHWGTIELEEKYFDLPHQVENNDASLEDERRLFYVALTRARKQVYLSHSAKSAEGKEYTPSVFLTELRHDLIHQEDTTEHEMRFATTPTFLIGIPRESSMNAKIFDQDFIIHQIKEYGFSVTAINNYLACSWKFFFSNLVRIPEGQSIPQMYGTAIHETLRRFYEQGKKGNLPTTNVVLNWFEEEIHKLPFSERDIPEIIEKGKASLGGFIEEERVSFNPNIFTEYAIRGVKQKVSLGESVGNVLNEIEVPLNGKLDKIDVVSTGVVNVYDFKTGKPKSRNDIEGKTKSSDGNYKRQLTFYQLLLSLEGKNRMNQGIIQFIEPDESGNHRREGFIISNEEVVDLVSVIEKITREIISGDFMNLGCEEKECQFCRLARTIRGESR